MKGRIVEKKYTRVTDIDEKIKNVSLPYFHWKVLFLVLEETNIDELVKALDSDEKSVQEALDSLEKNGILDVVESADETPEEKVDDNVEETQEEVLQVDEEPEEEQQEVEAEIVSETEDNVEETKSEDSEAPIAELLEDVSEESQEEEVSSEEDTDQLSDLLQTEPESDTEEAIEEEFKIDATAGAEDDTKEPEEEQVKLETLDEALQETEEDTKEDEGSEDIGSFMDEFGGDEEVAEEKQEPESGEETKEEPADEKKEKPSADAKTIMVIDDSIVIRKMVEIALEDGDYNIVTSNSGKEGLKLLDDENPDLVIVDMTLPDMNGIDLLKTVKASKGIPVIMLSGKDAPQLVESAKSEGADDFLPKPFRDDDLIEKVKNLLK